MMRIEKELEKRYKN
jgi:Tfp pilus assembly protein PilO